MADVETGVGILGLDKINQIVAEYSSAQDDAERQAVQAKAEEILKKFVNGNLALSDDALMEFAKFLEMFGVTQDSKGEKMFNSKIAEQAAAKFEGIIATKEEQERNNSKTSRIYSLNSDQNQMVFDMVTFQIYQSMGVIDKSLKAGEIGAQEIVKKIDAVKLTPEQKKEYAARFVDAVIKNRTLYESVPPAILADAYTATRDAIKTETDPKKKETYQARFRALATRIDFLIENFASQVNYWYVDPSNIMDVQEGYNKMFDVRQPDLQPGKGQNEKTLEYNKRLNDSINASREKLAAIIKEYDELYHLTQINPENAEELKQRWVELKKRLGEIDATPETLAVAAKYEFLDAEGKPIPQFLDEKGNPSLEYKEGYKLDPNGRLAQVINLSRNDVVMENVADLDRKIDDMNLPGMLNEEVPWTFAEISIPDQVSQGIAQEPNKMQDEAYVQQFWDNINTNGGNISDQGYQAALDAHVNHAAGYAERMAQKVGADKDIVYMPFETVQDIDKQAATRSEVEGAEGRKKKVGFFKRMAKNFGMAAAVSAGLTFIGKATGIAWAGAAIGSTIGVGNMIYQGFKWRKEQEKAGKPHGLKDFFKDKRNWGPAVASGLGVAATISMATGNPELAMGFGLGAVAAGTGSSAAMVYKDAINAGYTRGQALAGAIGVGASGILGAFAGRAAMNGLVDYVNNNTDSNLFKHEETIQTEHKETRTTQHEETRVTEHTEYETTTERHYADGVVESNERLMLEHNWETPESYDARINGLMDAGLSHDDAVRYLLAFHDATDHNLGPGYFDSIGMSSENLAALRNSISGTEINLTPESIAAFEHFNPHISAINQVGFVEGAPVDFSLPANASYDANGVLVHGNDLYSTYAEHSAPIYNDVTVTTPVTTYGTETVLVQGTETVLVSGTETIFTPNELAFPAGLGTLGIYEPRIAPQNNKRNLRGRDGALADKIEEGSRREFPHLPPIKPYKKERDEPVPPKPKPKPKPKPAIQDYDLMVDAKLNVDKKDAEGKKDVSIKVDGKMENVKIVSKVDGNRMRIRMVVPYNLNQGKGYYKVVYKTFRGEIKDAKITSRATDEGIHINIEMDGVSIKDKGRYKLYFQYVEDENQTEHEEIVKKTTRFSKKKQEGKPKKQEGKPKKQEEEPKKQEEKPVVSREVEQAAAILGVSVNATQKEVRDAMARLAKRNHPDRGGDVEFMQQVNKAYKIMLEYARNNAHNAPQAEENKETPDLNQGTVKEEGQQTEKSKRKQFERGAARVQTLTDMIEMVAKKEKNAKKEASKKVWASAHEALAALQANEELSDAMKRERAMQIIKNAEQEVR